MDAQTPMALLVRRGRRIITVDTLGNETVIATAEHEDGARWLFEPLRRFHDTTPAEEHDTPDEELGTIRRAKARLHDTRSGHAEVELSFGFVATVAATDDQAGIEFDLRSRRGGAEPFARLRVRFDSGLEPHVEFLEIDRSVMGPPSYRPQGSKP